MGFATLSPSYALASRSGEAGDVGRFLGDEFEQRRRALLGLLDAALDRVLDLPGLGDPLAIAAERLGEIGVIATDTGRVVFLGRDWHDLQLDRHREIVRQDREDRQALAHRRLEIHAGEADRRITPEVDAQFVGRHELRAHRDAETVAELCRLAPAEIGERRLADPEGRDLVAWATGVVGDDRVLDVDRVQQIPDNAVGGDRRAVGGQPMLPLAEPLFSVTGDLARDGGGAVARLALEPILDLLEQRVERQAGIADRRQIDGDILVDRIGIQGRVRDLLPLRHRRAKARAGEAVANAEDEIGVLQEMPEMRPDAYAARAGRQVWGLWVTAPPRQ